VKKRHVLSAALVGVVVLWSAAPVLAGSHLWVINEVFSNADGTVQFVEMHVPTTASNEYRLSGKYVRSTATPNRYDFWTDLPAGSTSLAYLLLGTAGFAALPGAPTPDHIVPPGFFDTDADTVLWWTYGTGDMSFSSGELPLDGIDSLDRFGATAQNSPTNFAGESGSVDASASDVPATSQWGLLIMAVLLLGGGAVLIKRRGLVAQS